MDKTAFSQSYILFRSISMLVACALVFSTGIPTARADGAPPPEPSVGGVAPYQPIETNVQMLSETVLIDVLPHPTRWTLSEFNWNPNLVKVRASFTLRNQGETEEQMQVIFPLTRLDSPWLGSSYNIIGPSFVAIVNGKSVPTTAVSTPPELQATPEGLDSDPPDGFFVPDVRWAGFDVTFPVREDVIVQVEYMMWGYVTEGLHSVDYILETGAGWYGRILSADISVHLPYPATAESVLHTAPGCVFSGNEVQCRMENFEPRRKDNLTFSFIDTNQWSPALELRSRVEQYPEDADAWYKLGETYTRLGFWWGEAIINQHMVDLSIEAFEKVAALRQDSGDAHLRLAHALWLGAPKKGTVEDPVVQRVLLEMQLAASHGISDYNYSYDYLSGEILRTIPDVERSLLPVPIRLTSVPTIPANPTVSSSGPVPTPGPAQKIVAMAVGNYHTCVLTAGAEVRCQGWNVNVPGIKDVTAVVAGDLYTCMLTTTGGVKCMGMNNFGQLGDGTTTNRITPVEVLGLTGGVSALVAGDNHTCALMLGGGVKCWGRNFFGQLGNGTLAYSLEPVDVNGLDSGVATLVAGNDHTCAFMQAGGIKCWGANETGQLGDGSLINRLSPVDIMEPTGAITALAAGFTHTCALNSQGQVLCWGDNSYGQLGDENTSVHTVPLLVPGLDEGVVKIAAGNGYTCALTRQGGVKCWGKNDLYPDPLDGAPASVHPMPYDVTELSSDVVDMAAGNEHLCALLQMGRLKCWGVLWFAYNDSEADSDGQAASIPTDIPGWRALPSPLAWPPVTAPANTSSPTMDLVWALGLLAAIGLLFLLFRRSRLRKQGDQ